MLRFSKFSEWIIRSSSFYVRYSPIELGKWHIQQITTYLNVKGPQKMLSKTKEGFLMNLDIYEQVQRSIFFRGFWQKEDSLIMKKILKKGSVFIDVGANVGYFSLLASKLVGKKGKIYAIEPSNKIFRTLKENLKLNNINNVYPLKLALTNKKEKIKLFSEREKFIPFSGKGTNNNQGASSIIKENSMYDWTLTSQDLKKKISNSENFTWDYVQTTTFDEIAKKYKIQNIDYIKIDVEGAEYFVLQGMKKTIKDFRPIISIELIKKLIENANINIEDLLDFIKKNKYLIYEFNNGSLIKIKKIKEWNNNLFLIPKERIEEYTKRGIPIA